MLNFLDLTTVDGTIVFFNEAEAVSDLDAEELDNLESKLAWKSKSVGKKEVDIKGVSEISKMIVPIYIQMTDATYIE